MAMLWNSRNPLDVKLQKIFITISLPTMSCDLSQSLRFLFSEFLLQVLFEFGQVVERFIAFEARKRSVEQRASR